MGFDLTGKLVAKFETIQRSATFKTREFVVETSSGMYNEYIKLQAVQDKCEILDTMRKGDTIKVAFDLRGKLVNTKDGRQVYITNINAWKIEKLGGGSMGSTNYNEPIPPTSDYDDVPF